MSLLSSLGRKGLFLFDPETAHGMSIAALKAGIVPACPVKADPRLSQTIAGLTFALEASSRGSVLVVAKRAMPFTPTKSKLPAPVPLTSIARLPQRAPSCLLQLWALRSMSRSARHRMPPGRPRSSGS